MAGVVDLLLRIKGDNRDAVSKLDDVARKADDAGRKVDEISDQRGVKIRNAIRAVDRITDAVTLAMAQVRVFADTVEGAGQWVNQNVFHTGTKRSAANLRQAGATSGAQAGDAFVGQVLARLRDEGSLRQGFRMLGDLVTGKDNPLSTVSSDSPELGRQARAQFREIALASPERAREIIANLGGTRLARYAGDFRKILDEILRAQAAVGAGQAWERSLTPVVNVYASVLAGGGRGSAGRQITAATEIRNRNNGRSTQTASRRG